MKINVDAAININRQRMWFGCVVWDESGHFVAAKNFMRLGVYKPKVAEAMGVHEALSWVKNLGYNLIHVKVDALQIVKDFHNPSSSPYSMAI